VGSLWEGSGIVAVKTTVGQLKRVIAGSPLRIFVGEVNYVDWSVAPWHNNALVMCFRKDSSYEHEAEVRAIIWDEGILSRNMSEALTKARLRSDYLTSTSDPFILRSEDGEHGIAMPFDPADFITEVVVGPREKPWVGGLVESVLNRYGLQIKLTRSNRLTPR
jgi:hypothetical protein